MPTPKYWMGFIYLPDKHLLKENRQPQQNGKCNYRNNF